MEQGLVVHVGSLQAMARQERLAEGAIPCRAKHSHGQAGQASFGSL